MSDTDIELDALLHKAKLQETEFEELRAELRHTIDDYQTANETVEGLQVVRESPKKLARVGVDYRHTVTTVYLAPGTTSDHTAQEIATEVMAAFAAACTAVDEQRTAIVTDAYNRDQR